MISEETIRRVKSAANIVDVMSDFHDLRKDGVGYTCLCPFHEDRHLGSFKISPRKNCYTCFSCGEHGGPVDYMMRARGLSFADSIAYLGKKFGIEVEGAERFNVKPSPPRPPVKALPTLTLPLWMVTKKRSVDNNFCRWLHSLNWNEERRKRLPIILKNYAIGTSKQGHAIFWQIDDVGNVRTGKMMLYKTDGHRDHETPGNFGWIHSRLLAAHSPYYNPDQVEMRQTLFGMHLLQFANRSTLVNIVESEKTAIICSITYGHLDQNLWLATGGKSNLSREVLQPIIKRGLRIVLYPDKDGVEEWRERAKAIGYKAMDINTSFMLTNWREEDGPKADMADILVRIIGQPIKDSPQDHLNRLLCSHPALQDLITKLDLEIVK